MDKIRRRDHIHGKAKHKSFPDLFLSFIVAIVGPDDRTRSRLHENGQCIGNFRDGSPEKEDVSLRANRIVRTTFTKG